jgi:iron transport multicopper oxidase
MFSKAKDTGSGATSLLLQGWWPSKLISIRLISMSCDPWYQFSIDGHMLTQVLLPFFTHSDYSTLYCTFRVIEADSIETQPYQADRIDIFAGQRYSFVLTADQSPGNYWVRALPNV